MSKISVQFDKLREFENNNDALKYVLEYKSIPMWTLARNMIIQKGIVAKFEPDNRTRVEKNNRTKNIIKQMTYRNPYFSMHKDIVYTGFPSSNFEKHEDGMLYDERVKAYVDILKKSSMIISVEGNEDLKYGYKSWKSDYIISKYAINEKRKKIRKRDAHTLKQFLKFLEDNCPIEIDDGLKKVIYSSIMFFSAYLERYVKAWKCYLQIVRPKLVVEYCGCFMGLSNVAMNLACDEMGIPTAEIQVAWIGRYMHSYCCGSAIKESAICRKMYPDFFLAWGKYWEGIIHNPCKAVTVGTHRKYEYVRERNNNILICVSIYYESYIKYIDYIMSHVDFETTVYLRIHPEENTAKTRQLFKKYTADSRFHFANDKDLRYYLNQCTYALSSGSTVVFEELACGKIVFVPKDNSYDTYDLASVEGKIYSFETLKEFSDLWEKRESLPMKAYNDFFDMKYEKLFRKFVKDITKMNIN